LNAEKQKPYLTAAKCGRCIAPFEISERWEGGTLHVTYSCPKCGVRSEVMFPPARLAEWERRARPR
jgi:hypothetical protein